MNDVLTLAGVLGAILGVVGAGLGLWKALAEHRAAPPPPAAPAARRVDPPPPAPGPSPAGGISVGTLNSGGGGVVVQGTLTDQRGPGSPTTIGAVDSGRDAYLASSHPESRS